MVNMQDIIKNDDLNYRSKKVKELIILVNVHYLLLLSYT